MLSVAGDGTRWVIQSARGRPVNIQADNIIDRDYIAQAERLIRPHVRRTPVIEVDAADFGLAAARLSFKLELFQHAGSFKTRGAFTNLLTRNIPRAGVVAASGGNHGAAVAYASLKLGIPAKIFLITHYPQPSRRGTKQEHTAVSAGL